MDRTDDFLQHWGVKGMKWDKDKKGDDAGEYKPFPNPKNEQECG